MLNYGDCTNNRVDIEVDLVTAVELICRYIRVYPSFHADGQGFQPDQSLPFVPKECKLLAARVSANLQGGNYAANIIAKYGLSLDRRCVFRLSSQLSFNFIFGDIIRVPRTNEILSLFLLFQASISITEKQKKQ